MQFKAIGRDAGAFVVNLDRPAAFAQCCAISPLFRVMLCREAGQITKVIVEILD